MVEPPTALKLTGVISDSLDIDWIVLRQLPDIGIAAEFTIAR